jgi:hypothetical protein
MKVLAFVEKSTKEYKRKKAKRKNKKHRRRSMKMCRSQIFVNMNRLLWKYELAILS